jgi:hypothetical protein
VSDYFPVLSSPLVNIVWFAFDNLVSVGEVIALRPRHLRLYSQFYVCLKILSTKGEFLIAIVGSLLSSVDVFAVTSS